MTKLSPLFGFDQFAQIQNHLQFYPIAKISLNGYWRLFIARYLGNGLNMFV